MAGAEEKARGFLLAGVGVTILSVDALMVKLPKGANEWEKILIRYGAYGAAMCAAAAAERVRHGAAHTRLCRQHIYGGVAMSATNICFVNSLQRTDASVTLSVLASAPLMTAVLGRLLLGEATPRSTLLACLAGFGCVLAVVLGTTQANEGGAARHSAAASLAGAVLALAAALGISLYSLACRDFYARARRLPTEGPGAGLPPAQSILPALALSGLLDVGAALAAGGAGASLSRLSQHDVRWLLFQGVAILPVSFTLISWGTKHLLGAEAMLMMLLETLLGPVWVYAALGEAPSAVTLGGGCTLLVILAANGWATLREERRARLGLGGSSMTAVVPLEALAVPAAEDMRPSFSRGRSTTRDQRMIMAFVDAEEREDASKTQS